MFDCPSATLGYILVPACFFLDRADLAVLEAGTFTVFCCRCPIKEDAMGLSKRGIINIGSISMLDRRSFLRGAGVTAGVAAFGVLTVPALAGENDEAQVGNAAVRAVAAANQQEVDNPHGLADSPPDVSSQRNLPNS